MSEARLLGDLIATYLTLPESFNTKRLAVVLLPRMVTSPSRVAEAALMVAVVLMTVSPPMYEVPTKLPAFMTGLLRVLLAKVSTASRVTIVPSPGKIAELEVPVPPALRGKMPVTAEL